MNCNSNNGLCGFGGNWWWIIILILIVSCSGYNGCDNNNCGCC